MNNNNKSLIKCVFAFRTAGDLPHVRAVETFFERNSSRKTKMFLQQNFVRIYSHPDQSTNDFLLSMLACTLITLTVELIEMCVEDVNLLNFLLL